MAQLRATGEASTLRLTATSSSYLEGSLGEGQLQGGLLFRWEVALVPPGLGAATLIGRDPHYRGGGSPACVNLPALDDGSIWFH